MRWALRRAVPSLLIASVWYGFLALFAYLARHHWEALVFVSLFALMGLFVLGAAVADLRAPYRTFYALTERRALIVVGPRLADVRSIPREGIGPLRLVQRKGDGDVVLAIDRVQDDGVWVEHPVGFLGIADARVAHGLVERWLREAPAETANTRTETEPEADASEPARRRR